MQNGVGRGRLPRGARGAKQAGFGGAIFRMDPRGRYVLISVRIIFLSFRAFVVVLATLSQTSDGVGTIPPVGSRCLRFERDPCSVSRVASL